jgi:hypothetical protein
VESALSDHFEEERLITFVPFLLQILKTGVVEHLEIWGGRGGGEGVTQILRGGPCFLDPILCFIAFFIDKLYENVLGLSNVLVVGLHGLACVRPPAPIFINIRGLVVKVLAKIIAIVSQSWLNVDFYIVR